MRARRSVCGGRRTRDAFARQCFLEFRQDTGAELDCVLDCRRQPREFLGYRTQLRLVSGRNAYEIAGPCLRHYPAANEAQDFPRFCRCNRNRAEKSLAGQALLDFAELALAFFDFLRIAIAGAARDCSQPRL